MKKIQTLAVLAMAATLGTPVEADDDCASRKKAIEAKLSARGVKNYTIRVSEGGVNLPGRLVDYCDNKKRKIVLEIKDAQSGAGAAIPAPARDGSITIDGQAPDARIAMATKAAAAAKATVSAKAAAAAKAASDAAAADAKAASAASLAAEAKAAANKAAADARAAAIEARTAAESRAAAAARVAADAQALADAAANEARLASEAKAAADAWATTAAKAASEAAVAASKAAADVKAAAEIRTAAQSKAATAAQKAAAEARVAASARAAADAIVIDPDDTPTMLAAANARTAPIQAAPLPRPAAEVKTIADTRISAASPLQFDGLYRAPISVSGRLLWKYFRFYPDGTFITVRSIGTPGELRQWFVREEPNNERGTFRIQGGRLLFLTAEGTPAGYDGSMDAGQVRINTLGPAAQTQHSDIYEFVSWTDDGTTPTSAAQNR